MGRGVQKRRVLSELFTIVRSILTLQFTRFPCKLSDANAKWLSQEPETGLLQTPALDSERSGTIFEADGGSVGKGRPRDGYFTSKKVLHVSTASFCGVIIYKRETLKSSF